MNLSYVCDYSVLFRFYLLPYCDFPIMKLPLFTKREYSCKTMLKTNQ